MMNSLWISLSSGLGVTAGDIQDMCLLDVVGDGLFGLAWGQL